MAVLVEFEDVVVFVVLAGVAGTDGVAAGVESGVDGVVAGVSAGVAGVVAGIVGVTGVLAGVAGTVGVTGVVAAVVFDFVMTVDYSLYKAELM